MQLTGELFIGSRRRFGAGTSIQAVNPVTADVFGPTYGGATAEDVDGACRLAAESFDAYRATTPAHRAAFLRTIGSNIVALGDTLIDRAMQETGLPRARLEGERARTVNQLDLFAQVLLDGNWVGAVIDSAQPERKPSARSDLRRRNVPLGPVAVFSASNFPLAFSVAGGDSASAWAAGCPVIVKAHSAHPGTSELVATAVQRAVAECGLPEGVFSLLVGSGGQLGVALVSHPAIAAVGFTGSRQGGLALQRYAQARAVPIPVYAEMSSINPLFLLPGALEAQAEALGAAFVESLTLGAGQFCTNPGLVLAVDGEDLDRFTEAAVSALQQKEGATMLTPFIHSAYVEHLHALEGLPGVKLLAVGKNSGTACSSPPALYSTSFETFLNTPVLADEVFGAASLMVRCTDHQQLLTLAEHLEGQLTATLHIQPSDYDLAKKLVPVLERKAGRLLVNGFPTGVEVSHAMVHGGPFPSTSDARSTSVGTSAIERFLRPVCYQDFPQTLLPTELTDANPYGLRRMRDGFFD